MAFLLEQRGSYTDEFPGPHAAVSREFSRRLARAQSIADCNNPAMQNLRDIFERHQATIYFVTVAMAAVFALIGKFNLEAAINPALALMLYLTFCQVPISELGKAFVQMRFLAALLVTNFIAIPLLVTGLIQFLPNDSLLKAAVLLVLLAPCIDYVVTFAQMGRADARLLLASTPVLLVVQMLLLPIYLRFLLGEDAGYIHAGPFLHAFVWLIAVPLLFAALTQLWAEKNQTGSRVIAVLGILPVPATALVLFIVIAAVVPQLGAASGAALSVVPVYIAFAIAAPIVGWLVAKAFALEATAGRAIAFSGSTRNSLVVLPLALAMPGAIPVVPAVIVTQTLIELLSELIYVKRIAQLGDAA